MDEFNSLKEYLAYLGDLRKYLELVRRARYDHTTEIKTNFIKQQLSKKYM